jgi:hypothetical protein
VHADEAGGAGHQRALPGDLRPCPPSLSSAARVRVERAQFRVLEEARESADGDVRKAGEAVEEPQLEYVEADEARSGASATRSAFARSPRACSAAACSVV